MVGVTTVVPLESRHSHHETNRMLTMTARFCCVKCTSSPGISMLTTTGPRACDTGRSSSTKRQPPQVGSMISSDVSRYPWQMMRGLAPAIAMRARPALEVPTPGKTVPLEETPYQSDPRGTGRSEQGSPSTSGTPRKAPPSHPTPDTQDTHNGEKVIQVPLALSAEGSPSAPKTPRGE